MVLKLYGYPASTCTRLVALICKEKGIEYEFVDVDLLKGEHKSPDYLKYQPFGQTPYINDDGFVLYESRAIARYLIKKHANQGTGGLIPTDPKEEALFEQATSIEAFNFNTYAAPLAYETYYKPFLGFEPDPARVSENLEKLEAKFEAYDIILGQQKYLAGDTMTLADLQHLPYGTMLIFGGLGEVFTKRPNIARWWNEIFERPTWLALKDWV